MANEKFLIRAVDVRRLLLQADPKLAYIVDNIRSVDAVEVVHGRWRLETDEEEPHPMFKLVVCSACNDKANGTYNYCPNCGAKMDAKE